MTDKEKILLVDMAVLRARNETLKAKIENQRQEIARLMDKLRSVEQSQRHWKWVAKCLQEKIEEGVSRG